MMAALGQADILRFSMVSASPSKADISPCLKNVRYGP
jgi:hypothetical protein